MANRVSHLIFAALVAGTTAHAQDFKIERKSGPNLVRESEELQLIKEPPVQRQSRLRERTYSLGVGQVRGEFVNFQAAGTSVRYDLTDAVPMIRLGYTQLPWEFEGFFGWQVSAAYGFQETKSAAAARTSLHVVPLTADILYRAKLKQAQIWAPQVALGAGHILYFQRGARGLNDQGGDWIGCLSAGLWVSLSEWIGSASNSPMDITVNYSRIYNEGTSSGDWSGDSLFLNLGVSI